MIQGFNATVFAYGATSAGKTHTMLGYPGEPGIMLLTLRDLFSEVGSQKSNLHFESLRRMEKREQGAGAGSVLEKNRWGLGYSLVSLLMFWRVGGGVGRGPAMKQRLGWMESFGL